MGSSLPSWAQDVELALPLHPQVLLTGNVRDLFAVVRPAPGREGQNPVVDCVDLISVLWEICMTRGYQALAVLDPLTSALQIRSIPGSDLPTCLAPFEKDVFDSTAKLSNLMVATVQQQQGPPVALVLPYTARLASANLNLTADDRLFLRRAEALGHRATPSNHQRSPEDGMPPYNTVFWVSARQEDLHPTFPIDSHALRVVSIPRPSEDVRVQAALSLYVDRSRHTGDDEDDAVRSARAATEAGRARALAEATHSMTVRDVLACGRIARDRGLEDFADAARLLRTGPQDDLWSGANVQRKIMGAEESLNQRVIGQTRAVTKAVDVLIRSAVGLNGAHASSSPNRPRGVLFLAGPTGVGKTELAKGIAALVLGGDAEPIRFDMSEFRMDEARQRLIGAPPGYVGYDAGGELTNAVRQNPVCVLLFDEIEKANPRVFDLFLQILEDGRLTDGRGATVYFTECFLVFTSNLGLADLVSDGRVVLPTRVDFTMDPADLEKELRNAFNEFFDRVIGRPELRNRFGDSFVVLDYIREPTAPLILDKALASVTARVQKVHGVRLELSPAARRKLTDEVMTRLPDGGRGIGNVVESLLVNPLARYVFRQAPTPGSTLTITELLRTDAGWRLEAECSSE